MGNGRGCYSCKALTVDSRASGVLDSTGEGLSVVDCVTDDF